MAESCASAPMRPLISAFGADDNVSMLVVDEYTDDFCLLVAVEIELIFVHI